MAKTDGYKSYVKLLAQALTRVEGGKVQLTIAQATEVVGVLGELMCRLSQSEYHSLMTAVMLNGEKRLQNK